MNAVRENITKQLSFHKASLHYFPPFRNAAIQLSHANSREEGDNTSQLSSWFQESRLRTQSMLEDCHLCVIQYAAVVLNRGAFVQLFTDTQLQKL